MRRRKMCLGKYYDDDEDDDKNDDIWYYVSLPFFPWVEIWDVSPISLIDNGVLCATQTYIHIIHTWNMEWLSFLRQGCYVAVKIDNKERKKDTWLW